MTSSFPSVDDRARHAAKGLNRMTSILEIPPSTARTGQRRPRAALVLAAAVIACVVVATVVVRAGSGEQGSLPAFEPMPWPGGQRVATTFQGGVSYRIPVPYRFVRDDRGGTEVDFPGHAPSMPGQIDVTQVAWHGTDQARIEDLVAQGDPRVRVLQHRPTEVGGVPATRYVLSLPRNRGDLTWFCSSASASSCVPLYGLDTSTVYLVEHDGSIVVIGTSGYNDRNNRVLGRVADGIAATWRWPGQ